MSKVQFKTVNIMNGEVLSTETSDVLDLDYLEALRGLRYRKAQSCTNAWETASGVIVETSNGYLQVFTVVVVP